jgi:hypothetical protein
MIDVDIKLAELQGQTVSLGLDHMDKSRRAQGGGIKIN